MHRGGLHVRGVITDSHGAPLAGVEVSRGGGFVGAFAISGADGTYDVGGFGTKGLATLHARAPGFSPFEAPIALADVDVVLDIRMDPGRTVQGRIVDETGTPVIEGFIDATAEEEVGPARKRLLVKDHARARTDAHGLYVMANLRRDLTYTCIVRKAGYAPALQTLATFPCGQGKRYSIEAWDGKDGEGTWFGGAAQVVGGNSVTIEIPATVPFTGIATLNGAVVSKARVQLREHTGRRLAAETVTDATGEFTCIVPANLLYDVTIDVAGSTSQVRRLRPQQNLRFVIEPPK